MGIEMDSIEVKDIINLELIKKIWAECKNDIIQDIAKEDSIVNFLNWDAIFDGFIDYISNEENFLKSANEFMKNSITDYVQKLLGEKKDKIPYTVRRENVDSVNVELPVFNRINEVHKFMDDIRDILATKNPSHTMTVNDYEILCGRNFIVDQAMHDENYGWTEEEIKQGMRVRILEDGRWIVYLPEAFRLDRKETK